MNAGERNATDHARVRKPIPGYIKAAEKNWPGVLK